MAQTARNNSGFSLIEAIIALFILLVALLGLLGALNLSMNTEVQNEIRNALLKIIEQKRNDIESNIALCDNYASATVINITNSTMQKYIPSYTIQTTKQDQGSNTICVANFSWTYKGKPEHTTRIIVVRNQ
ncbi:MAG: prepilin-type N-terminal cleavage/methylation domain-containing protein [Desulfurella sp.]|jgi:type IV pilus assembly protein PilV